MTEIRRCWAFHRDGMRCEHPAGHPGDHAVQRTWDDSDCAIPGQPQPPKTPAPLVEVAVKCVACGHQHKGGECKCGCREFIG